MTKLTTQLQTMALILSLATAYPCALLGQENAAEPVEQEAPMAAKVAIEAGAVLDVAILDVAMDVAAAEDGLVQAQIIFGADVGDPAGQLKRFLGMIQVENALVVRACEITAEQRADLLKMDTKWLKEHIVAKEQGKQLAAGFLQIFGGRPQPQPQQANSPQLMAARIQKAQRKQLAEILTPEQYKIYEKESASRDAFRRKAAAECLVALLDERLGLNATQRQGLVEDLSEREELDNMYVMFYFQNDNYVPHLPLPVLRDNLTKDQLKLFQSMQVVMVNNDQFNDGLDQVFIKLR